MDTDIQICQCCGGKLPMKSIWEKYRGTPGECNGSVTADGCCRAYGHRAWAAHDKVLATLGRSRVRN